MVGKFLVDFMNPPSSVFPHTLNIMSGAAVRFEWATVGSRHVVTCTNVGRSVCFQNRPADPSYKTTLSDLPTLERRETLVHRVLVGQGHHPRSKPAFRTFFPKKSLGSSHYRLLIHPKQGTFSSKPTEAETRISSMNEQVILVDPADAPLQPLAKQVAHNLSGSLPLHRGFSLLIFNKSGKLLLYKRTATKFTFPSFWTSVCSHQSWTEAGPGVHPPPSQHITGPIGRMDSPAVAGTKRAVLRVLSSVLGVDEGVVSESDLHHITRAHYKTKYTDGICGEHVVNYIFFVLVENDFSKYLNPNPDEVATIKWVSSRELDNMMPIDIRGNEADAAAQPYEIQYDPVPITPWLKYALRLIGCTLFDQVLIGNGVDPVLALSDDCIHVMGECKDGCGWRLVP